MKKLLYSLFVITHFLTVYSQIKINPVNESYNQVLISKKIDKSTTQTLPIFFKFTEEYKGPLRFRIEFGSTETNAGYSKSNAPHLKKNTFTKEVDAKTGDLDSIQLNISIPSQFYNLNSLSYPMVISVYSGINLVEKYRTTVFIEFEKKDYISVRDWNKSRKDGIEVSRVTQTDDYLQVSTNGHGGRKEIHKVKFETGEKFKYRIWEFFETSLFSAPIKIRHYKSTYSPSFVDYGLHNFGVHINFINLLTYKYHANDRITRHGLGFGLLFTPSVHTVTSLYANDAVVTVDPVQKAFISSGLSVNYNFNGLGIHFIPLAIETQIAQRQQSRSLLHGSLWSGFGLSYNLGAMNFRK